MREWERCRVRVLYYSSYRLQMAELWALSYEKTPSVPLFRGKICGLWVVSRELWVQCWLLIALCSSLSADCSSLIAHCSSPFPLNRGTEGGFLKPILHVQNGKNASIWKMIEKNTSFSLQPCLFILNLHPENRMRIDIVWKQRMHRRRLSGLWQK